MASLTVRQLDDRLKKLLRLRAARSGRSVEDEVRTILRAAAEQTEPDAPAPIDAPATPQARPAPPAAKHVLLIIGGGIAAYKSLDLIRRLKERGSPCAASSPRPPSNSSRRFRPAPSPAGACSPTCSIRRMSSTSATSAWRAKPI